MDIDALHSALISLTLVPEEVRSAREALTFAKSDDRTGLAHLLANIERDLRMAKAALANELGFPLCRCCWPPQLMATDPDGKQCCVARWEENEPTERAA